MTKEQLQDKCRGSLVGGAIGDALGYPVEFVYSFQEIQAKYGQDGITEYDKSYPWLEEHLRYDKAFSVIRHIDDFNACLICAVNHGGDSDSTGAVAGNIIGAILGYEKMPEKFTESIQMKARLLTMADALYCPDKI